MTDRYKLVLWCAVLLAWQFATTPTSFGDEVKKNSAAPRPSGVLSNAAVAAAAAADAATAAANAANAAAKAALSALEALNSIIPPSQQQGQSLLKLNEQAQLPVATVPGGQSALLAAQQVESSAAAQANFMVPVEQTLVGLVGKFEVPVTVDAGGEFSRLLAAGTVAGDLKTEPIAATNLTESVKAGRGFSREALAAAARMNQAQAQTGQAFAQLLPSVSLRASTGLERSKPSLETGADGNPLSSETHTRRDVAFTARQPLFDLPSYLDWQRRKVVEQARTEGQRASDADAYLATINAYLNLVATRLQVDMTRDFEAQMLSLQTYIEKRTRAGAASVSDMARVRARSQSAASSRMELESAHAAAGIEFVRLTNVVPRMVRVPEPGDVGAGQLPENLQQAVASALAQNPEVSSLGAELEAARLDQGAAKSRFLPRLDLEYTDNYSLHAGGDPSSSGQRDQRIMAVLNWNLFSGGSDYKYHAERTARHTELKYRLDDQQRRIVQGLSANYATLAATRERLATGYLELKSISTAADAMSKRMLSGNQSLLDLLDVYDRYYQVRVRLLNLHILEMNSVAQIVRLVKGAPRPEYAAVKPLEKPVAEPAKPAGDAPAPPSAPVENKQGAEGEKKP